MFSVRNLSFVYCIPKKVGSVAAEHKLEAGLVLSRVNDQVNTFFSVMFGWSHHFLGVNQYTGAFKCLAHGHYTTCVVIKPRSTRCAPPPDIHIAT